MLSSMTMLLEERPKGRLCGSSPTDLLSYFKVTWKKNEQLKDLWFVFGGRKEDFYTSLELVCAWLLEEVKSKEDPIYL